MFLSAVCLATAAAQDRNTPPPPNANQPPTSQATIQKLPAGFVARVELRGTAMGTAPYVVALIDAAAMLMGAAGIGEDQALAAIAPLVRASVANALSLGPVRALTGPVERGDVETISMHLEALAAPVSPTVRSLYCAAGLHALQIARRRGLSEANARRLEQLLRKSGDDDV